MSTPPRTSFSQGTVVTHDWLNRGTVREEVPVGYTVRQGSDGLFYARSQQENGTDYSGTDAATVIQNALNTSAGLTFVRRNTYTLSTTLSYKFPDQALSFENGTTLNYGSAGYAIEAKDLNRVHLLGRPSFVLQNSTPTAFLHLVGIQRSYFEIEDVTANAINPGQSGILLEDDSNPTYFNEINVMGMNQLDRGVKCNTHGTTTGVNANRFKVSSINGGSLNYLVEMIDCQLNFLEIYASMAAGQGVLVNNPNKGGGGNRGWVYFETGGTSDVFGVTFQNLAGNNLFFVYAPGGHSKPYSPVPLTNSNIVLDIQNDLLEGLQSLATNIALSKSAPQIYLKATDATQPVLAFGQNSLTRFVIFGASDGSVLQIGRYDNSQNFIDAPVTIDRTAGDVIFGGAGNPTVKNSGGTERIRLRTGSAGNRAVLKMWDATLAAFRYVYIDNGAWVISSSEPT